MKQSPKTFCRHIGTATLFVLLSVGSADCGHEEASVPAVAQVAAVKTTVSSDVVLEFSQPDLPRVYNSAFIDLQKPEAHFSDFVLEPKEDTPILFPESVKRRMIDCEPLPRRKLDPKLKATVTFALLSVENGVETQLQETTDRLDIRAYVLRGGQKYLIRVSVDNPQKCKQAEIAFSVLKRSQGTE